MKDVRLSERFKEGGLLFLRLGATSFGGPAAYIALMHHEIVVR
jgi:chromate transporter